MNGPSASVPDQIDQIKKNRRNRVRIGAYTLSNLMRELSEMREKLNSMAQPQGLSKNQPGSSSPQSNQGDVDTFLNDLESEDKAIRDSRQINNPLCRIILLNNQQGHNNSHNTPTLLRNARKHPLFRICIFQQLCI